MTQRSAVAGGQRRGDAADAGGVVVPVAAHSGQARAAPAWSYSQGSPSDCESVTRKQETEKSPGGPSAQAGRGGRSGSPNLRLCYVGPAIAPSLGGSALLFKLLQNYPADRLVSVTVRFRGQGAVRGLQNMKTLSPVAPPAWVGTRGWTLYDLSFLYLRKAWSRWLRAKTRAFAPEAVVCVVHGWLCEPALLLAQTLRIPFHGVFHDHASSTLSAPQALAAMRQRRWNRLASLASSRLCVSPFMAEEVTRLTGKACHVLYPGLAPQTPLEPAPVRPHPQNGSRLTFSFAGMLHDGYRPLIHALGRVLAGEGHRLVLHSPGAAALVGAPGACGLVDGGWIPTKDVAETLRREADAAFLPMAFRPEYRANTAVSFPSKLVEYCAAGLPVLIWAPPYSSAARWADQHPGFAEVVDAASEEALLVAVRNLADPVRRASLGAKALQLAREYFSHEATFSLFAGVLEAAHSPTVQNAV